MTLGTMDGKTTVPVEQPSVTIVQQVNDFDTEYFLDQKNGSPSATNVVRFVLGVVVSTNTFYVTSDCRVVELRTQLGDSIIHNDTVSDFQVKS